MNNLDSLLVSSAHTDIMGYYYLYTYLYHCRVHKFLQLSPNNNYLCNCMLGTNPMSNYCMTDSYYLRSLLYYLRYSLRHLQYTQFSKFCMQIAKGMTHSAISLDNLCTILGFGLNLRNMMNLGMMQLMHRNMRYL
jgi:hypothetical protein